MEQRVSVSISEGVADVRLVRADKMNALDAAMFDALVATSARLGREKGLRAVVLSGEGRAFCAGLDLHPHTLGARGARAGSGRIRGDRHDSDPTAGRSACGLDPRSVLTPGVPLSRRRWR